jgi:lipopolysaccharide transport system ATP-binding protein
MSDDVVIKVENLYKEYRLGTISHGTLYRDLQSWWAKMRGKEDPNSIISALQPSALNRSDNPQFLALEDVSFEVKRGEVLGIIGRNGAGKSTLLKILSEVTSPTRGTVKIKGRIASLLEVGTGFHPELTGRENIYLNGAILGMNRAEIKKKFDEIADFAGIEKFIDTPAKRYSSGMYVRLAFAIAAHLEPEILIVDEVLAVGDAAFQNKCLGKMGQAAKGGRTVLFVSHNMQAVKTLCPSAILLSDGKLIKTGPTFQVVESHLEAALSRVPGTERSAGQI